MATAIDENEVVYASFDIFKTETDEDGDLVVHGKASDGGLDSDQQIVDPAWMAKAAPLWLDTGGNVRVQHNAQRDPAGVGIKVETDSSGATWVTSKVFEPIAQKLVSKGALRAYSVGIARPSIVRDASAPGGRIVGGELVEVSLVDRPANKRCGITLVKSEAGEHAEYVGKVFGDEDEVAKAAGIEGDWHWRRSSGPEMWTTTAELVKADGIPKAPDAIFSFNPNDLANILKSKVIEEHYADLAMEGIKAAEAEVYKRDIDTATRRRLAGSGHALPDGSYPIANSEDLHNAAVLARSGHGNAAAARRLIARRAKELGVANPLDSSDDANKSLDYDEGGTLPPAMTVAVNTEKEAEAVVTKDPADGDGPGPVDKKKPKGKKLPPWLNDNKDSKSDKGDGPVGQDDVADDDDDDDGKMDCKMDHVHTEKCMPSGTPQSASGAKDAPSMDEMPDPGAYEHTPMPAGRSTPEHKGFAASPETAALLRFKSIGIDTDLGRLHDLTCAAYHPDDVAKYHPFASFKSVVDTGIWQRKAVDAACGPLDQAMAMTQIWQAAESLKGADEAELYDYRVGLHKAFRDANPGPTSYPTPGSITAERYSRPLITDGHSATSPGHSGPNTSPQVAHGAPQSGDNFDRPPLSAGHQSPSPSFMKAGFPYPAAGTGPQRLVSAMAEKERARQALSLMHDHLSRMFPGACPMTDQTPAPLEQAPTTIPAAVGKSEAEKVTDALHKAAEGTDAVVLPPASRVEDNAFKAEDGDDEVIKGARKKLAKKVLSGKMTVDEARSKLGRMRAQKSEADAQVLKEYLADQVEKGELTIDQARERLGLGPWSLPETTKALTVTAHEGVLVSNPDVTEQITKGFDYMKANYGPDLIKSAVAEAVAPLLDKLTAAEQRIEEQQKALDAIADMPDPSTAAFAGIAVKKGARPAGVPTQAEIAERTQQMMIRNLERTWRTSENPAEREAAYAAMNRFQS